MVQADQLSLARPELAEAFAAELLMLSDGRQTVVFHYLPKALGLSERPLGEPGLPAVLYAHGIQSHPGWFVGSAAALAAAGCEVFQVTRRGSGLDQTGRGDARSSRQLLLDMQMAVTHIRQATGRQKVALVGVSWGGKLLTAYALQSPQYVESLTLVAPGIVPRVDVALSAKLAILTARVFAPTRLFDIPLGDVALFTDNPRMRQYLEQDPHRLRRATARFLVASAVLDRAIARAPAGALIVPTNLILARRDRIIDNAATRKAVERLTGGKATLHELDGSHTLEFEEDPGPFFDLMIASIKGGAGQPANPKSEARNSKQS